MTKKNGEKNDMAKNSLLEKLKQLKKICDKHGLKNCDIKKKRK